jgi:hypothetical protein
MATGATGCYYVNIAIAGCNGATGTNDDKHLAIGLYTNQNYSSSYAIPITLLKKGDPKTKESMGRAGNDEFPQ